VRGSVERAGRATRRLVRPGLFVLLMLATLGLSVPAIAQVSETPSPSPTEAPSPSADPDSTPSPAPSVSPSPSPGPVLEPTPTPDPATGTSVLTPHVSVTAADDRRLERLAARARRQRHRRPWVGWSPDPRWGTYGTAALDRAARRARSRGWSEPKVSRRIYAPFIVDGPATWSDTWGAPRFTGGSYHPHHGQDVLCAFGAPVLAVERGTIALGSDPLGGRDAYLERADGSFWYYAHLKSYAPGLSTGDRVRTGDTIGRCGASGDATVPHVHFAFFTAERVAVDPMPALVAWLHEAERRSRTHGRANGTQRDVVGLLHVPAPEHGATFSEPVAQHVENLGPALAPSDRFLLAVALLSPFGWAAGAVAVRRRRAIATLSRG
jgi:murein DD-endopeptidase MepM/ murein hydrolase activator NlpD